MSEDESAPSTKFVQQPRPLVIIGAGGHAVSVANVALSAGFNIHCFVDNKQSRDTLLGYKVISSVTELCNQNNFFYAIGIGDNAIRERIINEMIGLIPHATYPRLIHKSAEISLFTEVGDGTVVMPKAVIGPNSKVGKFCLINTQASIDHDCVMLDYSSLAPAAVTGGTVMIGRRTAISIGAIIKHGINIGDDCVVGANSYLNRDLPSNVVAYGTPAKQVRTRTIGDAYLK
jgi:sugar O-acyltransferase (sialic acid O-acetyltransferase NeuD family)